VKGRYHSEDVNIYGTILCKYFKKQDVRVRGVLIWLSMRIWEWWAVVITVMNDMVPY
jgi:hypothetical protein